MHKNKGFLYHFISFMKNKIMYVAMRMDENNSRFKEVEVVFCYISYI